MCSCLLDRKIVMQKSFIEQITVTGGNPTVGYWVHFVHFGDYKIIYLYDFRIKCIVSELNFLIIIC